MNKESIEEQESRERNQIQMGDTKQAQVIIFILRFSKKAVSSYAQNSIPFISLIFFFSF